MRRVLQGLFVLFASLLVIWAIDQQYRAPAPGSADSSASLVAAVILALVLAAYFAPAIVARRRRHPSRQAIFAVNLLAGWTLIGWIGALAWALADPGAPRPEAEPADKPWRQPCPYCAEPILPAATICRFCRRDLTAGWANP